MPNTLGNTLQACVRGLEQMIVPAIDPDNPLALEQATLIARTIRFTIARLPHVVARSRQEMRLYQEMAEDLVSDMAAVAPAELPALQDEIARADALWHDPHAGLERIDACAEELAARIAALVRSCRDDDSAAARRIECAVLRHSPAINRLNRSWHVLSGFETRPEEIPPLPSLFPRGE
ncbi:hypothetical protein [Paracoccus sp. N5]|uniref:hypothetical protein n=1 Tax=Paracoccus sp. N5 TaxID=1101189 RepID=UPI000380ACD9|nr:hypothetical protein [Paracoccus sp. N5]